MGNDMRHPGTSKPQGPNTSAIDIHTRRFFTLRISIVSGRYETDMVERAALQDRDESHSSSTVEIDRNGLRFSEHFSSSSIPWSFSAVDLDSNRNRLLVSTGKTSYALEHGLRHRNSILLFFRVKSPRKRYLPNIPSLRRCQAVFRLRSPLVP